VILRDPDAQRGRNSKGPKALSEHCFGTMHFQYPSVGTMVTHEGMFVNEQVGPGLSRSGHSMNKYDGGEAIDDSDADSDPGAIMLQAGDQLNVDFLQECGYKRDAIHRKI
jgi:hypothetical protein